MAVTAGGPVAAGRAVEAQLRQAMEDVELKRHKRNPFASQFVSLATTPFGEQASPAEPEAQQVIASRPPGVLQHPQPSTTGRVAVEAAATNVHIRTELIRSMKNTLVKQTAEAVKRAAPTVPAQRARVGGKARQAAALAAAAAKAAGGSEQDADDDGGSTEAPSLFGEADEQGHEQLQQLLQGNSQAELLEVVQALLRQDDDPTRLPEAELSLDPSAELAPPPFEDFLQQMMGVAEMQHEDCNGTQEQAAMTAGDEAGLAAAVVALHQHTVLLEGQGVLQAAGLKSCWLQPSSETEVAGMQVPHLGLHQSLVGQQHAPLPAYLAGGQQQVATQHGSYEHWPAWQGPASTDAGDAIQDADEGGAAWDELEGVAGSQQLQDGLHHPAPQLLSMGLQRQPPAGAAVAVTFDDDNQQLDWCRNRVAWQTAAEPGRPLQQQQQTELAPGQAGMSNSWQWHASNSTAAGGDGGDPWAALDPGALSHGGTAHQQDQLRSCQAAVQPGGHVPVFASRRQHLAFSQPPVEAQRCQAGPAGGAASVGAELVDEEEDEWDDAKLQQVAALEQQALAQQGQQQGAGGTQHQPQHLRAPVFRHRTFTQQHAVQPGGGWPAAAAGSGSEECIEEADSDEEPPPEAAASTTAGAAVLRPGQRAVPQLGRRVTALPLAAASQVVMTQPGPGAAQDPQPGIAGTGAGRAAAAAAATAADSPLLRIDFSTMDLAPLQPSVLLGRQAGGKQRWKPVLDPEYLLLPVLRAGLPVASPEVMQQQQLLQQAVEPGPPAAAAVAAELVAGLTAEDLAGWDDWEEQEGGSLGLDSAAERQGATDTGSAYQPVEWQQQQQQQQHRQCPGHTQWHVEQQQQLDAAVDIEWYDADEPPASQAEPTLQQHLPQQQQQWWQTCASMQHGHETSISCGAVTQPQEISTSAVAAAAAAAVDTGVVEVSFDDDCEAGSFGISLGGLQLTQTKACGSQHPKQHGLCDGWGTTRGTQQQQQQPRYGLLPAAEQWSSGDGASDPFAWGPEDEQQVSEEKPQPPQQQNVARPGFRPRCGQLLDAAAGTAAAVMAAMPHATPAAAVAAAEAVAGAGASQDPWAALQEVADGAGDLEVAQHQEEEEDADVAVVLWDADEQLGGADASTGMEAEASGLAFAGRDPWAALDTTGDVHAAEAAAAPASSAAPADALPVAAVDDASGVWGCDIHWEDAEQQGQAQRGAGTAGPSTAAMQFEQQEQDEAHAAAAEPSTGGLEMGEAFDWQYDDEVAQRGMDEGLRVQAAAAGSASARLALAFGTRDGEGSTHVPSSKRRHDEIGAQIIRTLLEERRRDRVDLQPLLVQLCERLAAALAGGGTALLSELREQCLRGGAPGADASLQRYLLALLTAAHLHNSGAASRAQQQQGGGGSSGGAVAVAVGPLAVALSGLQLRLTAVPGGAPSDVAISTGS